MELRHVASVTLLVALVGAAAYTGLLEGDYCTTVEQRPGKCIDIQECDYIWEIYHSNDRVRTPEETRYILKSQCGQKGRLPLICCENQKTSAAESDEDIVVSPSPPEVQPSPDCTTPDGYEGSCISIFDCGYLHDVMNDPNPMNSTTRDFIIESECIGDEEFSVCCRKMTPEELLPSPDVCGIQQTDDKIIGGQETAIDEYPWMVLLEYVIDGTLKPMCGGSLISSRYVLTAAHCITENVVSVRIGEHNITSLVDCQRIYGGLDCNYPFIRLGIDGYANHPLYSRAESIHDIALIRLQRHVEFTDFIVPICLPTKDITENNGMKKLKFTVAGWGVTNNNRTRKSSDVKMRVTLPYINIEDCINRYPSYAKQMPNAISHMCAGEKGKDACGGDSGGPLMHMRNGAYEVVGVVSFGPTLCGSGLPGAYTKVFLYRDWILNNLRP